MPDDLYELDILTWAEEQAALLRRLAAGERVNASIDWTHLIEEVHDVGLSELRACRSLLRQALAHLLKVHAWPDSPAAGHWRGETIGFLDDARDRFTASMGSRLDLDELYRRAADQVRGSADDAGPPRMLPVVCPFTVEQLLAERPDLPRLLDVIDQAATSGP